jgi:hypothetical protein
MEHVGRSPSKERDIHQVTLWARSWETKKFQVDLELDAWDEEGAGRANRRQRVVFVERWARGSADPRARGSARVLA